MHEFVLAQQLIDEVILSLNGHSNANVVTVNIGFGPFTHATFDRIEFWWNTLVPDTPLKETKLVKNELEGKLYCPSCNQEFSITELPDYQYDEYLEIFACPECGSYQTKILEGTDIIILNIEISTTSNIVQ